MSFRFENLNVWQDARRFVSLIYKATKTFPKEEKFGLVDQYGFGSCEEVVTAMYISLDQGFINKRKFDTLYIDANKLVARINSLAKSLE